MNKPEDYCAKCGAELEPGDHPFEELCDTCKAELARRWKRIVDDYVPRGTPPDAEPTRPGKIKKSVASPTVEHLDKGDICFHGSMFNPNCPVCLERRERAMSTPQWPKGYFDGKGSNG